jgi:hypothetical protein
LGSSWSQFGRKRSKGGAGRDNNGHAAADQVGHQSRHAAILAFQPMVLDRYVLTLEVAGFSEGVPERRPEACHAIGRSEVYEPDDGPRHLLRARRERPSSRAAERG